LSGAPSWVSLNTHSGVISIAPPLTGVGTYAFTLTAGNAIGTPAVQHLTLTVAPPVNFAGLIPDPLSPGQTMLVIGAAQPDTLGTVVQPDASGNLNVSINGVARGTFRPTGHIVIYGNGTDAIHLKTGPGATPVRMPAFLIGGAGNETLDAGGSSANNVLVGGAGNNKLVGGSGRDILIGGPEYSALFGAPNQDVLLSGTTSYGPNLAALNALMAEWGSQSDSFNTRVSDLQSGGGANGNCVLDGATVAVDALADLILPGSMQNLLINTVQLYGPQGSVNPLSSPALTFSWSAANGADHYQFLLVDLTTGQTVANSSVYGTSYTLASKVVTPGHAYRWWIQPMAASSQAGVRSAFMNFVVTSASR